MDKKIPTSRYVTVLSITVLIFIIGILLGQLIADTRVSGLTEAQENMKSYLLSLNLQNELASQFICNIDVFELTRDRTTIGFEVDSLESRLGSKNLEVVRLKKEYSLLSIRQWLLIEEAKEKCNQNYDIILFFYSNEENKTDSQSQGFVLDYLYNKYPDKIVIYSFDVNLDDPSLNTLKRVFNVSTAPTVVINGKLYEGFQEFDTLEALINSTS